MQNSLNNDGLYRVYFDQLATIYVLIHEKLWLHVDNKPYVFVNSINKLYAGTGDECIEFVKSQPENPEGCIVLE
jgi:hypothetical protein